MMYFSEGILLIISIVLGIVFLFKWYGPILRVKPRKRCGGARAALSLIPIISFCVLAAVISTVSAPTVSSPSAEGYPFWIIYYIIVGFAWILCTKGLIFRCFDLSWQDDVLAKNHTEPALLPVIGAYAGLTMIYAGANIGDGPGWWCVIYAAGTGTAAWLLLGHIVQKATDAFGTVTIGRDLPCAIRMSAYLIAGGAILAHASAGDSITPGTDIINIAACSLTAVPLAILAIFVEKHYAKSVCISKNMACSFSATGTKCTGKLGAFFWSAVYLGIAIAAMFANNHVMRFMEAHVWTLG
jgi:hypothetical protein